MLPLRCRDAEDAVFARDGYDYDGYRLRVEFPKGGGGSFRPGTGGGGGPVGRGRGPPARRSQYRCVITGLPPSGSWQDLKVMRTWQGKQARIRLRIPLLGFEL